MLSISYTTLQLILLAVTGSLVLYLLVFSIAGLFGKSIKHPKSNKYRKIAVLIPGYKEDAVIVEVAMSALQQQYPLSMFDVVVIADSFQPETLLQLKRLPIKLIEVSFDKSTKAKALNAAMASLTSPYELAVILDADNLMAPNFLAEINNAFDAGCKAVQGHRVARNLNNNWAVLDAISEEINNHIFRKGHRALGLASAIIGSGMAFEYAYFKELMSTVKAVGGFDKEIELKMLKQGYSIEYLQYAMVYDEKIQSKHAFTQQRRRWLAAQFHYLRMDIIPALKALILRGNINYFDKAIQFAQPSRLMVLGILTFSSMIFIPINLLLDIRPAISYAWIALLLGCTSALMISIPRHLYNRKTLVAVASLPSSFLAMMRSMLQLNGANKQFIHTVHHAGTA